MFWHKHSWGDWIAYEQVSKVILDAGCGPRNAVKTSTRQRRFCSACGKAQDEHLCDGPLCGPVDGTGSRPFTLGQEACTIDTAPLDGREILLLTLGGWVIGFWDGVVSEKSDDPWCEWFVVDQKGVKFSTPSDPTHWAPLPPTR